MMKVSVQRITAMLGSLAAPVIFAGEEIAVGKAAAPVSTVLADNNITSNLLQTTMGLLAVLAVIAIAAWGVKRFGNFRTGVQGQLKIVGGVSLGTRERVVLLQVGEQQLVLGVAPGQIRTLHVLDEPLSTPEMKATPQPTLAPTDSSFAARLKSAIQNGSLK